MALCFLRNIFSVQVACERREAVKTDPEGKIFGNVGTCMVVVKASDGKTRKSYNVVWVVGSRIYTLAQMCKYPRNKV